MCGEISLGSVITRQYPQVYLSGVGIMLSINRERKSGGSSRRNTTNHLASAKAVAPFLAEHWLWF